jgi:hypothetical protein
MPDKLEDSEYRIFESKFWRNEERLKGYSSAYRREMYRKAKETKENEEETGEVAEP